VTADLLQPGDRFGTTRDAALNDPAVVEAIESIGEASRYIRLAREAGPAGHNRGGGRIRPRHTTLFWRQA
jgi:hypothetical protein